MMRRWPGWWSGRAGSCWTSSWPRAEGVSPLRRVKPEGSQERSQEVVRGVFPEAVAPRAEGGADGGARPQLALERLEIRRMPGFRRQGRTLAGLSEGIHAIYGPDGAGKTTTAPGPAGLPGSSGAFQPGHA